MPGALAKKPTPAQDSSHGNGPAPHPDRRNHFEISPECGLSELQQRVGNRATDTWLRAAHGLDAVGRREKEADQVAAEVIRSPSSPEKGRAEKQPSPTRSVRAAASDAAAPSAGDGRPLPESVRSFMESGFSRNDRIVSSQGKVSTDERAVVDFSKTHIHTGPRASRLAELLHARAFAVGRHVFFGSGEFQPQTESGRRLLAHELAHTLQQSHAGKATIQTKKKDSPVSADPLGKRISLSRKFRDGAISMALTLKKGKASSESPPVDLKSLANSSSLSANSIMASLTTAVVKATANGRDNLSFIGVELKLSFALVEATTGLRRKESVPGFPDDLPGVASGSPGSTSTTPPKATPATKKTINLFKVQVSGNGVIDNQSVTPEQLDSMPEVLQDLITSGWQLSAEVNGSFSIVEADIDDLRKAISKLPLDEAELEFRKLTAEDFKERAEKKLNDLAKELEKAKSGKNRGEIGKIKDKIKNIKTDLKNEKKQIKQLKKRINTAKVLRTLERTLEKVAGKAASKILKKVVLKLIPIVNIVSTVADILEIASIIDKIVERGIGFGGSSESDEAQADSGEPGGKPEEGPAAGGGDGVEPAERQPAGTEASTGETSTEAPTGETSTETPTEETSTEAPTGEASAEAPVEETSTEAPTGGTSTEAPTGETSTEAPTGGTSTEAPTGETSTTAPAGQEREEGSTGSATGQTKKESGKKNRPKKKRPDKNLVFNQTYKVKNEAEVNKKIRNKEKEFDVVISFKHKGKRAVVKLTFIEGHRDHGTSKKGNPILIVTGINKERWEKTIKGDTIVMEANRTFVLQVPAK